MTTSIGINRSQVALLWSTLFLYVLARLCQLYADRAPTLLIVILHVIPPAIFAIIHGSILYRLKGISIFAAFCLGFGGLAESISLRTGFPFGHYYFTDAMGPKVLHVPVLLVLAYLGIGYVSWVLALLILGYLDEPIDGVRIFALPLLASFIMLAWDLSMDPDWSTLDHVWIWQHGGPYFGVPLSNFFGWFLTAYIYYLAFALYCRAQPIFAAPPTQSFWCTAILLYATCATGNPLILRVPMAPPVVTDATGKQWLTADILGACTLMSLLLMTPLALLAWLRLRELRTQLCRRCKTSF
jgi:putative membrane protein